MEIKFEDGIYRLIDLRRKFEGPGSSSKGPKTHFGCVARCRSGKHCSTMEQVEILFQEG